MLWVISLVIKTNQNADPTKINIGRVNNDSLIHDPNLIENFELFN